MLIAFVHTKKAFLPALQGYVDFFRDHNIQTITCSKDELQYVKSDVEWHFMGVDTKARSAAVKIHDYSSASTPPFASLKNKLKSQLNIKPDFRLFSNQFVFESLGFSDNVPFGFRDVGVSHRNVKSELVTKEFDFIYVGEIRSRRLDPVFDCFSAGKLSNKSLLILSRNYESMAKKLRNYLNIQFKGPVAPGEVAAYIRRSHFGINYIPNIPPFNQQTSTKFLEYAANRVPIITTKYPWVENFESKQGGRYFYLKDDLSNFTWDAVNDFQYEFPDLSEWTWEYQIKKSGILEFLSSRFPVSFCH